MVLKETGRKREKCNLLAQDTNTINQSIIHYLEIKISSLSSVFFRVSYLALLLDEKSSHKLSKTKQTNEAS
jgi:hypothetical protein